MRSPAVTFASDRKNKLVACTHDVDSSVLSSSSSSSVLSVLTKEEVEKKEDGERERGREKHGDKSV